VVNRRDPRTGLSRRRSRVRVPSLPFTPRHTTSQFAGVSGPPRGAAAGPPSLPITRLHVAWSWRAGDTIPLGYKTLRVIDVRNDVVDEEPVLVVEDVSNERPAPPTATP
jgi:hypothetical protein